MVELVKKQYFNFLNFGVIKKVDKNWISKDFQLGIMAQKGLK